MQQATALLITNSSQVTMSSLELAKLTGKAHKNIIRDIRVMLEQLEIDGSNLSHVDQRGYLAEFLLPKDLTLTLVSGYNVKLRKKIIDRWMELEGGRETKVAPPRLRRPSVLRMFKTAIEIGKLAGLEDNMLALHAGCYCKAKCGENPLELMEVKTLPALENERTLSPTEIGEKLGLSAQRVNEMLCHLGLQHHTYDKRRHRIYHLTGLGKEYGRLEDASRAHSDGSVTVLRWYPRVIDQLEKHLQAQRYPRLEQGLPVVEAVA